jgi:hypothetical protein
MNNPILSRRFTSLFLRRAVLCGALAAVVLLLQPRRAAAQATLLDFNTVGQFTNNFGGRFLQTPGTAEVWFESTTNGGVGGAGVGGALDGVLGSANDTTLTYLGDAYDFSQDGKTINVSMMVKIKAPTANNRALHLGFMCSTNQSMNDVAPAAYVSVRLNSVAQPALTYAVEMQNRATNSGAVTGNASTNFTLVAGNWYQLSASFRNVKTVGRGQYLPRLEHAIAGHGQQRNHSRSSFLGHQQRRPGERGCHLGLTHVCRVPGV